MRPAPVWLMLGWPGVTKRNVRHRSEHDVAEVAVLRLESYVSPFAPNQTLRGCREALMRANAWHRNRNQGTDGLHARF